MKRSINEISGMVLKAARGAGIPLGHCEDMALAAGYLAATDPVRLSCVQTALRGDHTVASYTQHDGRVAITAARVAMAGPIAIDALQTECTRVVLHDIDAPRMMLALCAARGVCVTHRYDGADLILTCSDGLPPAMPVPQAVTVSALLWLYLTDLAAHLYVPASDASRLAGAGAGLNDND
jgi:hypothetical protein